MTRLGRKRRRSIWSFGRRACSQASEAEDSRCSGASSKWETGSFLHEADLFVHDRSHCDRGGRIIDPTQLPVGEADPRLAGVVEKRRHGEKARHPAEAARRLPAAELAVRAPHRPPTLTLDAAHSA